MIPHVQWPYLRDGQHKKHEPLNWALPEGKYSLLILQLHEPMEFFVWLNLVQAVFLFFSLLLPNKPWLLHRFFLEKDVGGWEKKVIFFYVLLQYAGHKTRAVISLINIYSLFMRKETKLDYVICLIFHYKLQTQAETQIRLHIQYTMLQLYCICKCNYIYANDMRKI